MPRLMLVFLCPPLCCLLHLCSFARQVESVNTVFSFGWWVVGFSWLLSTFNDTFQDAPLLSW